MSQSDIIVEAELAGGPLDGAVIPPCGASLPPALYVSPDHHKGTVRGFSVDKFYVGDAPHQVAALRYVHRGMRNAAGKALYHHEPRG